MDLNIKIKSLEKIFLDIFEKSETEFDAECEIRSIYGIDPIFLNELSFSDIYEIKCAVAINECSPLSALMRLYEDDNFWVFIKALENINTPSYILESYSDIEDNEVKLTLAQHPRTPMSILEKLANDKEQQISEDAKVTIANLKDFKHEL